MEYVVKEPNYSCLQCGLRYYRYPSSFKKNRDLTCSRTCAARYFRDKGTWKTCPVCSTQFYQRLSVAKLGYGNYCSHACWGSLRQTPIGPNINAWTTEQKTMWLEDKCCRCGATDRLELD